MADFYAARAGTNAGAPLDGFLTAVHILGKKTLEAEILKEALDATAGPKKHLLRSLSWPKDGSR